MKINISPTAIFLIVLMVLPQCVVGQGNSAALPMPKLTSDSCKRDVMRFQEDLRSMREAMGEAAASTFQEKFMTKKVWDTIMLNEGYCGLAQKLREKKLVR